MGRKDDHTPTFARPRRGYRTSIVDALVVSLWKDARTTEWPEKTLNQLYADVASFLKRDVNNATIRAAMYRKGSVFERAGGEGPGVKWRLTRRVRGS